MEVSWSMAYLELKVNGTTACHLKGRPCPRRVKGLACRGTRFIMRKAWICLNHTTSPEMEVPHPP